MEQWNLLPTFIHEQYFFMNNNVFLLKVPCQGSAQISWRPGADYEACHSVVLNNIQKLLNVNFENVLKEVSRRQVYILGKLFIKCAERGLTDPFKGGNVKLKSFMDSLKHACKVPNTDQPYACVDMMVVGVILDKVLGLHQSSMLLTPHQVMVGGQIYVWL